MPKLQLQFWKTLTSVYYMAGMAMSLEFKKCMLLDARKRKPAYLECGFTLVHNKSAVTDWKEVAKIGTPDNMAYRAEMEKAIRALHPDVAEFVWVAFLLRGGPGENPPAAGAAHLDVFPDGDVFDAYLSPSIHREEAVGRYKYTPANGVAFNEEELKVNEIPRTRAELLALKEAQALELGFQMGTWQPRCPKVYDFPLFMSDARYNQRTWCPCTRKTRSSFLVASLR